MSPQTRVDPVDFSRRFFPVAAGFLLLAALGCGLAAFSAQTSDPVVVRDVGSFVVPEEARGRALYVSADVTSALDEPRCLTRDSLLEDGGAFGLTRQLGGERTRLVARLGPVADGGRVTCSSLAGERGWLAQPAGTRWLMTGMAVVLLGGLCLLRLLVAVVAAARGPQATGR